MIGVASSGPSIRNRIMDIVVIARPPQGLFTCPSTAMRSRRAGLQGVCDGSSHHWCDKIGGSSCLMTGSQDNRGTVCFNSFSGWLVVDVKDVKHGFIGARMEAWGGTGADGATEGWTEVNNGGRGNYDKSGRDRRLHEEYQERMRVEFVEQMKREIKEDVLAEGDPTRRRLGGGSFVRSAR